MTEERRPSPANMPRRRVLPPPPHGLTPPRYADRSGLPRSGREGEWMWLDTGVLLALARRPSWLRLMVEQFGPRLRVVTVVADEVRRFAAIPAARRYGEKVLIGTCADALRPFLDGGDIQVLPVASTELATIGQMLAQLKALEVARGGGEGPSVSTSGRHSGEASTIAAALRAAQLGQPSIFVTSDGGASLVAESRGLAAEHVGDLLAALCCARPDLNSTVAYEALQEMTQDFGTPPVTARISSSAELKCLRSAATGDCAYCQDRLTPRLS